MATSRKVLITDDVHPLLIEGLQASGFEVHFEPLITPDEVLAIIDQYEGLLVNSKVYVGKEMLNKATHLKFMGRAGSGLEVFDLDYAKEKGVIAFNSPEGNRNAVGEMALGMLLNIMRNIAKADAEVRQNQWNREPNRGHELSGKTVAFIAFGNTAQAFAKLLRGFNVNMLAYDKYLHNYSTKYVTEASLEQIFEQADVLSLHLPLTPETRLWIDYSFLSRFKKPVWLVNTSRGSVMNTADLLRCLTEGKILAAALDVLENEKLNTLTPAQQQVFERLIQSRRILFTPHIAGWTVESKQKIAEILLGKIRKIYSINEY